MNNIVLIFMIITTIVLVTGLGVMAFANKKVATTLTTKLMSLRVIFQLVAILLLLATYLLG